MPRKTRKEPRPSKTHHLAVVIEQDEDGVFIVSVPSLVGCRTYGRTIDEAMENITEAAALALQESVPANGSSFVGVRSLEIVA